RGAVRALAPRRPAAALPGLLDAVRARDDRLRSAALGALVGWPSARVHTFFLEALESNYPPLAQLDRHLARVEQPLDPASQRRLATALLKLTGANGWRGAARANRLVRHLEPKVAVPFLLEALRLWVEREREGRGSRRIRQELVDHLRRISGRSLGTTCADWTGWWRSVCDGRIPLADEVPETQLSTASFFGLRPISDRVVFVLDRSGSMKEPFHADGKRDKPAVQNRYDEAVEQVFRYLTAAGDETRFGLVVFSDGADRWQRELEAATPGAIDQARRWLERREPAGGTHLRPGIDLACQVDRDGAIDLETLEADTIVVLCDGATAEGPAWVDPWLTRHAAAELVFHGVLIQTAGDGTLRALSEGTGGDFIVVGR
ncbi:MAG: VWA domain-containing protein, partial [Planctomycetota bacterium]